jgi:hypothetical protein
MIKSKDIPRWQEEYDKDCDRNKDGLAEISSRSYMQTEIDNLRDYVIKLEDKHEGMRKFMRKQSKTSKGRLAHIHALTGVNK